MKKILWNPSPLRIEQSTLHLYENYLAQKGIGPFEDQKKLWEWSVKKKEDFWKSLFDFFSIKYEGSLDPVLLNDSFIPYSWFSNVRLNFAENLLNRHVHQESPLKKVIVAFYEDGVKKEYSIQKIKKRVGALQSFLKDKIDTGDVVSCYMPNIAETVITMLATSGLG